MITTAPKFRSTIQPSAEAVARRQSGQLGPKRIAAAVEAAVKTDARDLVGNRNAPLSKIIRPQAANQWSMLPYLSGITPQWLENVLRGALVGNHLYAWQLFDLMLDTSSTISSCAQEFVEGIQRKKLLITPAHEEDEEPAAEAVMRHKIVSACFRNFHPDPAVAFENGWRGLLRDLAFARFYGTNILEIDYHGSNGGDEAMETAPRRLTVEGVGEIFAPRTVSWVHPVCYGFQNGRCGLNAPMLQNYREVSQRDARGRGRALTAFSDYSQRTETILPFTPDKFLIANFKAQSGPARSILRPLAWYWCMANFSADWLANNAQLWQLPWRIAKYAPGTDDESLNVLDNVLQNAGSNPWMRLPEGCDIQFEWAQGSTGQSPSAYLIELCDRKFRELILRQTMSAGGARSGAGNGAGAFGAVEAGVKSDAIDAGAEEVAEILKNQLARSILNLNCGDAELLPEIELSDKSSYGLTEAQTVSTLITAGMTFSRSDLHKRFDFPAPRDEADALGAPAKAETATADGPAGAKAPEGDSDFKRKAWLAFMADGTVTDVIANMTELKELTKGVGLPVNEDYEEPYLPVRDGDKTVVGTPGAEKTGEERGTEEGEGTGADRPEEQPDQGRSDARASARRKNSEAGGEEKHLEASASHPGEKPAEPATFHAQLSTVLRDTIAPLVKRIKAIGAVEDEETRQALLTKFLADEPALKEALEHDRTLVAILGPGLENSFANALQASRADVALEAAGFNPDQPRDDIGRWTDAGGGKSSSEGWTKSAESEKAIKISHPSHGEHWIPKRGVVLDEKGKLTATERVRTILEDKIQDRERAAAANKVAAQQDLKTIAEGGNPVIQHHADGSQTISGGTIIRETDKAVLYSHPDYEDMWMPKSQVRIDGDRVTMPGWLTDKKLITREVYVDAVVAGETEKAYKLRFDVLRADGEPQDGHIFVPKSLTKVDDKGRVTIPRWLKAQKEEEFIATRGSTNYGQANQHTYAAPQW